MSWIRYFFLICAASTAMADVTTKVIDTGAGLATVTRFPNGDIFVYDTGHWNHDREVFGVFKAFIGENDIDLLITSHSDSDHIAATDELFNEYRVHRVIRTGFQRDRDTWKAHDAAIRSAAELGLTHDVNLRHVNLPHGTTYQFGEATVTYLSGFHKSPKEWGLTGSEYRNGNSIVVRVDYKGNSILFTGDSVGRVEKSSSEAPAIATERYLIDNASNRPIRSTILIAPHHGGDDASSTEFISAVSARWVVFPSGSGHKHPRKETAERYLTLGYKPECLLRTDFGDKRRQGEWEFGSTSRKDPVGDDGIYITLPRSGDAPNVSYESGGKIECDAMELAATTAVRTSNVR